MQLLYIYIYIPYVLEGHLLPNPKVGMLETGALSLSISASHCLDLSRAPGKLQPTRWPVVFGETPPQIATWFY